jgi:hypothetical protein
MRRGCVDAVAYQRGGVTLCLWMRGGGGARELKKKTKETKVGHFVFFLLLKMLHII